MIKNVIFDLGNVVFLFKCDDAIRNITGSEEEFEEFRNITFSSQDWKDYDRGLYTKEQMTEVLLSRVEEDYKKDKIRYLMDIWTDYLYNNEMILDLIKRLRENGYKTYILSNAPFEVPELVEKRGIRELFDGAVFSCYEHINKPDPELFRILLDKYDLEAEECAFLDDRHDNCDTANSLGIFAVCYRDYNHEEAIENLKKLGINI